MSVSTSVTSTSTKETVSDNATESTEELKSHRIEGSEDPFGEGFDDKRLWVGNLDPKTTEFLVLKVVEKYGKIRKLDFIYHKGGPDKGLSKGYCFVSFHSWEAAEQARKNLDGKHIKGRPLYVKWARGSKFQEDDYEIPKKDEVPATSKSADTALASATFPDDNKSTATSPQSKIQAIEAKLKLMESTQQDFGIHQSIQAHPEYNPLYRMENSNRRGGRSAPYRRGQSGSGYRSRPRR